MPAVSRFYGITIYIYWEDHNPPHYHAVYGEHEAVVLIGESRVLFGSLPRRALRLVRTWHQLPQTELEEAWHRAEATKPIGTIEPLP